MPPLSKTPILLPALPIVSPVQATCAEPFDDVRTIKPGPFHYPAILGRDDPTARPTGVTVVVVAVDRDGSVVDAWVWEPIGTPMLDQAVVNEALKAKYSPGKAFCENVPGYFVLRSVFTQ
jgi:outer membrane biosynthesis protein TonB